jgi:hypothetical protein
MATPFPIKSKYLALFVKKLVVKKHSSYFGLVMPFTR